jgi:hypothetical protein
MRTIFALLAIFVLGSGMTACAGTSSDSSSSPHAVPPGGYWKYDGDKDPDEHEKGPSHEDLGEMTTAAYGANTADKRAITAVLKSYFTAAVSGESTKGCSLLAANLATAVTEEQSQLTSGTTGTCATSLSRLLSQQHKRLVREEPTTMVVTGVHVRGNAGFATLGFRAAPESEMVLLREGNTWKIDALFDSTLP